MASEHHGAIAQLGERLNGIQEVTGSIPVSSTGFFSFSATTWGNSLVRVAEELFKALSLFSPDDAIPVDEAIDVTHGLAIRQLFVAELRALLADVPRVTATREALVGSDATATPTEIHRLEEILARAFNYG